MSIGERIEQVGTSVVTAVVLAIGSGLTWLIRRVLTNQKQIELLQSEIRHRDQMRREDRDAVKEIKDDVKALRSDIQSMFRRKE